MIVMQTAAVWYATRNRRRFERLHDVASHLTCLIPSRIITYWYFQYFMKFLNCMRVVVRYWGLFVPRSGHTYPATVQGTFASVSQRKLAVQVKLARVDVRLNDEEPESGSLVERSYTGSVLGAIVTGSNHTFHVHSVARSLVKVTIQAKVRSCFRA